jgi:hypothetical protein
MIDGARIIHQLLATVNLTINQKQKPRRPHRDRLGVFPFTQTRAFYKIPNSFNLLSGTTPFTQPRTR